LSFLTVNSCQNKSTLGVEQKAEAVSALLQLDNIHESSWEIVVSTDFSVHLDAAFHANLHALFASQSVL
jgi:hypothetical protein